MEPDKKLPKYISDFLDSTELIFAVEDIAKKHNLHVDQLGELDAEIRDILRGQAVSTDFVKDVSKRLEVDRGVAEEISRDVNIRIFQAIKTRMQNGTLKQEPVSVNYSPQRPPVTETGTPPTIKSPNQEVFSTQNTVRKIDSVQQINSQMPSSQPSINSVVGAANNSIGELRNIAALESVGNMQVEPDRPATESFESGNMNRETLKNSVNSLGGIEIRDEHNSFYNEPPANLPGAISEGEPVSKSGIPPLTSVPKYNSDPNLDPYKEPLN